ncbi:ankyrin repeat domain-containing protein [Candidatus Babeliales bacterium]|nr:ankyrin repeat domain-containing protein [Candidatus Babeliales bacterium]
MKKHCYFFLIAWLLVGKVIPIQARGSIFHKILLKEQTLLAKKQWQALAQTIATKSSTLCLNTLLEFAIINPNDDTVSYPALSPIITFLDEYDHSLLHLACSRVNESTNNVTAETMMVNILLGAGSRLNQQDNYGQTPLHLACSFGKTHLVELLLEHGADPNIQNRYGDTPLHQACWLGWFKTVDLLVLYKAIIDVKNTALLTPYDLAYKQLDPEIPCDDLYKIIGLLASTNPSITQNLGTPS